ncbi:hypothetical protein A6X21_04825 [Planctopirus hydrillae]|uniref:Uncharacterized protein n=2 Tax=Planctopirus hydrillae TaxID=1841610 RepID=A0A1C3ENZ8_9PLAN|nr:hypothetical protein A6X21_04825 [Planctopirus hydrillae]
MSQIRVDTYYRMSHVTGPGCVLVSLRFGTTPDKGPWVTIRAARGTLIDPSMDVDAYVAEVTAGVADANGELGSAIEVEEIQIVPNDFPRLGQVRHCAKTLTLQYKKSTEQEAPSNGGKRTV